MCLFLGVYRCLWSLLQNEELEYNIDFLPKIKVEIVIEDKKLQSVIEIIKKTANTGKIGDGKIFIYNIEKAIRIRTNEEDEKAI